MLTPSVLQAIFKSQDVVQVNIPAESGEMGVLANHVPSIEQLKPGLIEVIEESGGSKQFFCKLSGTNPTSSAGAKIIHSQYLVDLQSFNQTPC